MKTKFLSLIIFSIMSVGINAQWYNAKYGVNSLDELSNNQLMTSYTNARTTSIVGGVLTGIGIMTFSLGVASDFSSSTGMTSIVKSGTWESYRSGSGLRTAGILIALGGTVTWIAGGSRKRQLKPLMTRRGLKLSIAINPGIGCEPLSNSYFPSLSLNFRF